jgi:uncharacterized protein YjiS (DUF1127 family)
MSRMNEMNQALRRQSPRSRWLLELATPSVALGRGLPRNEFAAQLRAANVNRPGAGIVEALNRAMKRRQTANQLKRLDSRLLDDIGIIRGDIDVIAAKVATEAAAREGLTAMPLIALLVKLPAAILAGLTDAYRRQATIVALQRLSNHTLADIGIERGRIPQTVDTMMVQAKAETAPVRTVTAAQPVQPVPAVTPAANITAAPARQAA